MPTALVGHGQATVSGVEPLAHAQLGLLTRAQCLGLGMTPRAVKWMVRARRWQRVYLGVYATQWVRLTGPLASSDRTGCPRPDASRWSSSEVVAAAPTTTTSPLVSSSSWTADSDTRVMESFVTAAATTARLSTARPLFGLAGPTSTPGHARWPRTWRCCCGPVVGTAPSVAVGFTVGCRFEHLEGSWLL